MARKADNRRHRARSREPGARGIAIGSRTSPSRDRARRSVPRPHWLLPALLLVGLVRASSAAVVNVERVSLGLVIEPSNANSFQPSQSADGRFVAFASDSTDLLPDGNLPGQVFVADVASGGFTLVSVSSAGVPGNRSSSQPSLSADGRFVAFSSNSSNLVPGEPLGDQTADIYVHDRDADQDGRFDEAGAIRTQIASLSSGEEKANNHSGSPAMSGDGRVVAFLSSATNLSLEDTNNAQDVFVRDLATGETERININGAGEQADRDSINVSIDQNGSVHAFDSLATNLAPGNAIGRSHVYVRDRATRVTQHLSAAPGGEPGGGGGADPSITADGREVAFWSGVQFAGPPDSLVPDEDVFVRDRSTGGIEIISVTSEERNGDQGFRNLQLQPAISADGRYVSFVTTDRQLAPGIQNLGPNVFLRDRMAGTTVLVSGSPNVSPLGSRESVAPTAPTDRPGFLRVAFASAAENLVTNDTNGASDVFLRVDAATRLISAAVRTGAANGASSSPDISGDGRVVAFTSDATNIDVRDPSDDLDVFVAGRNGAPAELVTFDDDDLVERGSGREPSLSGDGRFVAFSAFRPANPEDPGEPNFVDLVVVYDRATQTSERASFAFTGDVPNGSSGSPALSVDGRFIAYQSAADDLVALDFNFKIDDVFVYDRVTGINEIVSVTSGERPQGNRASSSPAISRDGRHVAFASEATNLAPGDINDTTDVFVRDRERRTTVLVSQFSGGGSANGASANPAISEDGRFVAFTSQATNLAVEDADTTTDVYVHDRDSDGDGIFDEAGAVSTRLVSRSSSGEKGNRISGTGAPTISADGRLIGFESLADNLVPDDPNGSFDVFVHDRVRGLTELVSLTAGGNPGDGASSSPAISADGRAVAFRSDASNLVPDGNPAADIFVASLMPSLASGQLVVGANQVKFPPARPGQQRTRSLQIRNVGRDPLMVGVAAPPAPFRILMGGGVFMLSPGERRTVLVGFTPPAAGPFTGILAINSSDPAQPLVIVRLSGRGSGRAR